VEIPKEQVLEFVGGGSFAFERAHEELPERVDTERDATLLAGLGVDVPALLGQLNGSLHRN
jgi:hypothetical protein